MTKENSFTLFKTPAWNISVFSVGSFMTMGLQLTTFYRFTYYHALDDLSLQPNMISHIASPGLPSSLIIAQNFSVPMFVLGTISLIKPINVNPAILQIDAMIMLFVMGLFLVFSTYGRNIVRKEGIILITIYILYIISLIWRG